MGALGDSLRSKPASSSSGRGSIPSVWRGSIVETYDDGTVAARVPSLYGEEAVRIPTVVAGLTVGARVLIVAIEGRRDDLVVLTVG